MDNLENGISLPPLARSRAPSPGHGAPGGPELLDQQTRYHSAIRTASGSESDDAAALARIRSLFPGYLLQEVLPATLRKNR